MGIEGARARAGMSARDQGLASDVSEADKDTVAAVSTDVVGVGIPDIVATVGSRRGIGAVVAMGTVGSMGVADDGSTVAVLVMDATVSSGSGAEDDTRGIRAVIVMRTVGGIRAIAVMGTAGRMGVADDGLMVVVLATEATVSSGSSTEDGTGEGAGDWVGVAGDG